MTKKKPASIDELTEVLTTLYSREEKAEERLVAHAMWIMQADIKTAEGFLEVLNNRFKSLEERYEADKLRRAEAFERNLKYLTNKLQKVELATLGDSSIEIANESDQKTEVNTKLLQAFSYTVFDTILFSITKGSAPDFTLISQSALFETVYLNISRGYESYLFQEVPFSAKAAIIQGRMILENLRETEERFLDEPDLWEVYAPQIQKWWVDTALPLIFGERDPDWDNVTPPTYDEMQRWTEGEFSRRQFFPAVTDLIELAKDNAAVVADTFDFKQLLAV